MSVVQSSPGGRTASGTSAVTTFTNLPITGRSIVAKAWGSSSAAPTSLAFTDNQTGNTYVVDVKHQRTTNVGSWTAHARMFFAKVTAGTFAVTVSGAPAASEIEVSADEVSDLDGTVNTSNSNDATTGNASTGAITTTKPDCYLSIAMSLETASNPATVTTPANFNSTNKQLNGASFEVGDAAYRYVQAIQTAVSPAWTNTSAQWSASIVAYGVNPFPAGRPKTWIPSTQSA